MQNIHYTLLSLAVIILQRFMLKNHYGHKFTPNLTLDLLHTYTCYVVPLPIDNFHNSSSFSSLHNCHQCYISKY